MGGGGGDDLPVWKWGGGGKCSLPSEKPPLEKGGDLVGKRKWKKKKEKKKGHLYSLGKALADRSNVSKEGKIHKQMREGTKGIFFQGVHQNLYPNAEKKKTVPPSPEKEKRDNNKHGRRRNKKKERKGGVGQKIF